jgi:hypothetical protein
LELSRALGRELDTPQAKSDLSVSLDIAANAASAGGNFTGAESLFGESLALRRALALELDTLESKRDLSDH